MYKNAAEKLFGLVKTITVLMMCASILGGVVLAAFTNALMVGILVAVIGCLMAWLSNLIIATFAQIGMDLHALASDRVTVATEQQAVTLEAKMVQPQREWWTCAACGQKNVAAYCQSCGVTKVWSEDQKKQ